MKIIIATPLYPPDTDETAIYVKELGKQLKGRHEITIVTYGEIPEKIKGVDIVSVSKKYPLPIRLLLYTLALWKTARKADVVYAQNGPSVELPACLISLLTRKTLIIHTIDKTSHGRALENLALFHIENFALKRAKKIISDIPLPNPEILPFESRPEKEIKEYEESWKNHINALNRIFEHEK